nr:hypothetical protein BaRGS_013391 [Batillaria attramentaria]
MFFMRQQPANQFVIRAYLCQAQLLAPQDANNPEQLDKAVVYLLKAIAMAKKTQRYYFLVYNASVLYWNFCRPFLKPNYRQFLARSLHQVVKALDDIEDTDYEWRAQLMIALIECHLDAGRRSDASHIATAAATFIKQNVPSLYKQVFGLMVRYQLVESSKLHKDVKTSPELSVFYKICKLKNSVDLEESREYYTDVSNILAQIGVSSAPTSSRQERLSRRDTKGTSGRRSPSAHSVSPTGEENTGSTTTRKSPTKGGRRTPTPTSTKKLTAESADSANTSKLDKRERPFLLLELAHLCLDLKFPDLAATCVDSMKTCTVKEQGFYLQLEFLQCLMMVKSLEEKQESYQRPVVDLRLQAIKRCEEAIMNAIRFGDPNVIQAGCVTQWNLCLPLTQPNLRKQIRKPLTLIAEALENIQSLLVQLRCQVHTELARCEEDMEQIQVAMEHLKKALALDDGSAYQERLEVMLRRLELRSQLYRQPERPEDQAAMIIEQARTADSGTIRMKRSLLVKAGEALAPDAFLLVLDSESDTKDEAGGRGPLTVMKQLGGKARAFNRCVRKAEGHLKRLGDENDRERARLWADLAKTARKQEVWDVCRVAARFCLLYDDGRWKNAAPKPETPKPERTKTDVEKTKGDDAEGDKKAGSRLGSRPMTPQGVSLYDKDLIRMLAEVNFINGEALVHLLRSEGVQLNDKPIPPEDKRQRPKGYVPKKPEEDPDWTEYCDWIAELSDVSTKSFLRGLQLGVDLIEPWLVCCAATYIWNYNNHILSQNRHREIVPALTTVLDGLKKVGHAGETIMLVNICKALAYGLIAPWFPAPPKEEKEAPAAGSEKAGKGAKLQATPSKIKMVTVSAEAGPDVKKAVEVCEFAIGVTSGDNPQDVVPIAVRQPLLQTWVTAKQMGQQQINKTLGTDDETSTEGQKPMTRAIVATEMLSINKNGIMEFKDTPFIADIAQMVEDCHWTDHFIELQLWTRLTALAYESHMHNLVMRCSKKALRFAKLGTQPKARRKDKHQHMVEQEMLSFASCLQGQSLIDNMAGKNSMRREAMESFLNAASQPIERELLKEPLKIILECIAATSDKKIKTEEPPAEEKPEEEHKEGEESKEESQDRKEKKLPPPPKKQPAGMIGKPGEDLTLRASMYGVLFQSYADQGEWELALEAMDQAVTDMPRTKHRLLIFKHRVMVKAKLGRSVHMDIAKFKDESEDYVAHMWRRVALSSKELCEQLSSYQNAIESLNSASNEFQKVEYLLEFGQWLYANEFPLQDVLDQIEWAVDILLNVQDEGTLLAKKEGKGSTTSVDSKKGGKGKRSEKGRGKGSARSRFSSSGRKSPGVDLKGKKTSSTTTLDAKGKKVSVSSTMGADTKSEISDQDSEINAADYVPVVKEAIIGVLPINPSLTINDLTDVRQLDACVRAHVLLAELTGRDGACYADILLQAYGYLHRLWQVLLSEAGPAMKEIAKSQTQQVDAGSKGGKGSGKAAKGKEKEAPPVKEKPKRKGPLDAVPEMVEDWAIYDAPEEIVEALQHETMHKTGINENTLPKPMLTMHYLNSLTKQLRDLGYTHLALPVLAFEDLLSRSILKSHALNVLVHARSLEVCQELALKPGCEFHEFVIGNIRIREEDQSVSRQEIALWKEKQVQVSREEMRVKETLARMGTSAKSKDKMPAASAGKQANASKAADDDQMTVGHIGQALGAVCLRQVWADTAEVLIRLGYMQRAREFLNEANIAAEAFSDKPLQGQIMFLFGKLAFEEAQYGQAINFCRKAQALSVLGEAESLAEQVYFDALTLTSLNEMRNVSLPVQRELANTTACRGEVLLEVAAVQVKEMRALQLKEQQKGAAQRIVEDYTRQTPNYTPTQRDWLNNRATVFEEATAAFLSAHGLAGHMTDLKAREQHELSKLYLTFATECLTQALNLALANKHTAIAGQAALELVKCHGQFDPAAASQFLALYQSCQNSLRMEELLYSAQKDPITSKLAALLHQRRSMLRDSLSTNLAHSTLMATVTQTLEKDWQAWKLLEVLPQHMDMLKEFPPNFNFVVLQHSPDKNFLYGAVLDKSKAGHLAGGGGKGNPKHTAASSSRAKVFGIETSPRLLEEIIGKFRQHKASVQAFLLKQEYQRSQATLRQKMLENLDDSLKPPGKMMLEESVDEAEMLEEEFRELVGAMETYLKPIMSFVDSTLRSSYSPTGSTTNIPAQSRQEKDTGHECVILLADADLMELPLEALTCLRADGISALSRDFSLQLLFHRMHQGVSVEALLKEDDKDKKKAKEAAQAVSRIPGARDVKAKQAKIVPLARPVQPWQAAVDTMNFKYIVDPELDCTETEERKPIDEFNKIMEEYEQQFTPRWLGVPGDDHCPSVGEWEIYLTESSSFIFYGFERLLSYIPPAKMSALNIPDCMILYCLDLAQTSRSFMRQSKVDVDKSREDLLLERPLEAAMLASLTGTRCIMSNQWYCTLEENNNKIILSMKDLLEKGKTTGQSVRLLLNPRKRHEEERALEAAEEQALSQRSDGKEGGKQKKEGSAKSRKDDGSKKDDASKGDAASSVVESGGASHRAEEEGDPDKDKEEPKEDNFSVIQRSWFNMVCYGMPNLIVTQ